MCGYIIWISVKKSAKERFSHWGEGDPAKWPWSTYAFASQLHWLVLQAKFHSELPFEPLIRVLARENVALRANSGVLYPRIESEADFYSPPVTLRQRVPLPWLTRKVQSVMQPSGRREGWGGRVELTDDPFLFFFCIKGIRKVDDFCVRLWHNGGPISSWLATYQLSRNFHWEGQACGGRGDCPEGAQFRQRLEGNAGYPARVTQRGLPAQPNMVVVLGGTSVQVFHYWKE